MGDMIRVTVGDIVKVKKNGCHGIVRFIGETQFKPGIIWYGIQLEEKKGKNNGIVDGVRYFLCDAKYGMFVKETQIECIQRNKKQKHKKRASGKKGKQNSKNKRKRKEKVNILDN